VIYQTPKGIIGQRIQMINQGQKKSFSLIELIVVISVLAILSSMIVPSVSRTLLATRGVACQNNLKINSASITMYAEDFGFFPLYHKANTWHSDRGYEDRGFTVIWDDLLGGGYDGRNLTVAQMDKNILKGEEATGVEMYACPLDDSGARVPGITSNSSDWIRESFEEGKPRTYSINCSESWWGVENSAKKAIAGQMKGTDQGNYNWQRVPWTRSISDVSNPSGLFLLVETPGLGVVGRGWGEITGKPESQLVSWWFAKFGFDDPNLRYHSAGWNYLFVDGHTENLLPEETEGVGRNQWVPRGYWTDDPND